MKRLKISMVLVMFSTNETEWKGVEIEPILMSRGLAVKLTVDPFERKDLSQE